MTRAVTHAPRETGNWCLLRNRTALFGIRIRSRKVSGLVERALGRRNVGPYQLQAAIAAVHAESRTAAETDWKQIAALYGILNASQASAIVSLNHAVAIAMSESLERGLALIEGLGALRGTRFLSSLSCGPRRPAPTHGPQPGSPRELPPWACSYHQHRRASLSSPSHIRAREPRRPS